MLRKNMGDAIAHGARANNGNCFNAVRHDGCDLNDWYHSQGKGFS